MQDDSPNSTHVNGMVVICVWLSDNRLLIHKGVETVGHISLQLVCQLFIVKIHETSSSGCQSITTQTYTQIHKPRSDFYIYLTLQINDPDLFDRKPNCFSY